VNLVCGKGAGAGGDKEHCRQLPEGVVQRDQKSTQQEQNRDQGDIAVRVDEVPAQEVIRIDVMEAEGPEETGTKHGDGLASPGVRDPMNNTAGEVREKHASQNCGRYPPREEPRKHREAKQMEQEQSCGPSQTSDLKNACQGPYLVMLWQWFDPGPHNPPPRTLIDIQFCRMNQLYNQRESCTSVG